MTRMLLAVLFIPFGADALVITEIMYDLAEGSDTGREWIEVYNAGAPIDLLKYKVIENGSQHKISGPGMLPANTYAVIADNPAKFKNDHPAYSGILFDSAFSLNNDGETLALADPGGGVLDSVQYTNASGNGTGDSLQRNPGSNQFDAGISTPGAPIPAAGLVKSTPPQKTSKKANAVAATENKTEIVGESTPPSPQTEQVAAVALAPTPPSLWLFATSLLALVGGAGLAYSHHLRKSEWDIVEETG